MFFDLSTWSNFVSNLSSSYIYELSYIGGIIGTVIILNILMRIIYALTNYKIAIPNRSFFWFIIILVGIIDSFINNNIHTGLSFNFIKTFSKVLDIFVFIAIFQFTRSIYKPIQLIVKKKSPTTSYFLKINHSTIIYTVFIFCFFSIVITLVNVPLHQFYGYLGAMLTAMAFIFREYAMGIVANFTLFLTGSLKEGNWIKVPDVNADGEVLSISSLRISIRNWDHSITIVPTGYLLSHAFENWENISETGGRRIREVIAIDPLSIQRHESNDFPFLEEFQKTGFSFEPQNNLENNNLTIFIRYCNFVIEKHPQLNNEMVHLTRIIYTTEKAFKGILVEIYWFAKETNWAPFERVKAEFLADLYCKINKFGLKPLSISEKTLSNSTANLKKNPTVS